MRAVCAGEQCAAGAGTQPPPPRLPFAVCLDELQQMKASLKQSLPELVATLTKQAEARASKGASGAGGFGGGLGLQGLSFKSPVKERSGLTVREVRRQLHPRHPAPHGAAASALTPCCSS